MEILTTKLCQQCSRTMNHRSRRCQPAPQAWNFASTGGAKTNV
ncbi:hypothetical protein F441_01433 [Phytophthora nicotianae CJ01A1]|uniref:Uncharacterized protein n=5 Tax=Phytophthora nicotianae TaxID=4792 RepID=W2QSU1_PHYN3|nr:hypothetical protein PPTG_21924 [Phytophthora nicotianae INRA-310]ETK95706.1 hypothetical protein L915_01382 [Phytophthora nicotianae]ETO84652.1 hypothetical protein F444_01449 [Phytophthora nicotianae P1976]ETP25705.1 hypothetical protein F441_01433 [Phytophthora nicotianae CJ01A1]ETP53720.1 hypothetical protein F442_01388 [Phytophthora nicotianae P10297]ETL49111.1 hypothetical protein L916_01351 [Phytophthora nicotianae]